MIQITEWTLRNEPLTTTKGTVRYIKWCNDLIDKLTIKGISAELRTEQHSFKVAVFRK